MIFFLISDIKTIDNTARGNAHYEIIGSGSPDGIIVFGPNVTEVPISLMIMTDDICQTAPASNDFFIVIEPESIGDICLDSNSNVLDTVTMNIVHDDGKIRCNIFGKTYQVYRNQIFVICKKYLDKCLVLYRTLLFASLFLIYNKTHISNEEVGGKDVQASLEIPFTEDKTKQK